MRTGEDAATPLAAAGCDRIAPETKIPTAITSAPVVTPAFNFPWRLIRTGLGRGKAERTRATSSYGPGIFSLEFVWS
jgi:hypothetical protein